MLTLKVHFVSLGVRHLSLQRKNEIWYDKINTKQERKGFCSMTARSFTKSIWSNHLHFISIYQFHFINLIFYQFHFINFILSILFHQIINISFQFINFILSLSILFYSIFINFILSLSISFYLYQFHFIFIYFILSLSFYHFHFIHSILSISFYQFHLINFIFINFMSFILKIHLIHFRTHIRQI